MINNTNVYSIGGYRSNFEVVKKVVPSDFQDILCEGFVIKLVYNNFQLCVFKIKMC